MEKETYLGDSVYASFDGWQIQLRTGDGNNQVIYLEPGVYSALLRYVDSIRKSAEDGSQYATGAPPFSE